VLVLKEKKKNSVKFKISLKKVLKIKKIASDRVIVKAAY